MVGTGDVFLRDDAEETVADVVEIPPSLKSAPALDYSEDIHPPEGEL